MDIDKNISIFIEDQFSQNYRENGPLLVQFIECYYKWALETGNPTDASRSILELYDPDTIGDEFLDFLHNEFLAEFPKDIKTNKRTLIKNILSFYESKGTPDSYKMLFRILYNTEINIYFPGDDILRASDGKWYIGKRIILRDIQYTGNIEEISEVIGSVSKATARVDRVTVVVEGGIEVTSIYLTNIRGTFLKDELVRIKGSNEIIATIDSNGILEDEGYWLNTDGQLSADKYLQDNFYYQEFSYEIQSQVSLVDYESIVNNLIHPAGTKLFGKFVDTFIIDMSSNSDIDIEMLVQYMNDNFVIDVTDLDVVYEEKIEFEETLDRDLQEVGGIGQVSINDGQIQDFADWTAAEFGTAPISAFGKPNLIVGTGTSFSTEIAQPNGIIAGRTPAKIKIMDTENGDDLTFTVNQSYSNRLLTITQDYPYPVFTNEDYNIIRETQIDDFGGNNYVTLPGTGTITWNNGTQLFNGTGTLFNMEIQIEDIVEIISTGARYLVTGVGDDTLFSVFTGEGPLTTTITNQPFRVYKNSNSTGGIGDFVTWNAQFVVDGFDYLVYPISEYVDDGGDNWTDDSGNIYTD